MCMNFYSGSATLMLDTDCTLNARIIKIKKLDLDPKWTMLIRTSPRLVVLFSEGCCPGSIKVSRRTISSSFQIVAFLREMSSPLI